MQPTSDLFGEPARRAGFRLQRLEVYNWGTFDGRVWSLVPDGESSLLTGEYGSGKSTLVDAFTTLLTPPRRITFNKAAGAESGERSLYSYLRGEYKALRNEFGEGRKAEALRDEKSLTVLLARWSDERLGLDVTLAQLLWLREGSRTPERIYVVAELPLAIAEDFGNFGGDLGELRKHLRKRAGVKLFDSFSDYGAHFRRLLGMPGEQVLELLYQTISMKSVGNLTDFVRAHMLEAAEVEPRIADLLTRFSNLVEAHEAVRRARRQIEALQPLVAKGEEWRSASAQSLQLRELRDALSPYFAARKCELLIARIEDIQSELRALGSRDEQQKEAIKSLREQLAGINAAIENNGGGRIRELDTLIAEKAKTRQARSDKERQLRALTANLGLSVAETPEAFSRLRERTAVGAEEYAEADRRLRNEEIDKGVEFKRLGEQVAVLRRELESLKTRVSNIPAEQIRLRADLAAALSADESELPFVGELLQVAPEQLAWEGALERLLHGFALSLLVGEGRQYEDVSHYVNRTHLGARLVYLRAGESKGRSRWSELTLQNAARKLNVKSESPFRGFLERELAERFEHVCCESLEQFRRQPRGLTREGQIRANERQHEKDDRRALLDRSRYVLGWSNKDKIKTLEKERQRLEKLQADINKLREGIAKQRGTNDGLRQAALQLLSVESFSEIDWWSVAREIQSHEEEKQAIENSSERLRALRTQQQGLETKIATAEIEAGELQTRIGGKRGDLEARQIALGEAQALADKLDASIASALFAEIDALRERHQPGQALDLRGVEARERELRDSLQKEIDASDLRGKRAGETLTGLMQKFRNTWPAESVEMDAATEALPEYEARLQALIDQDLPRHELRFQTMLREDTINDMAAFRAFLENAAADIKRKIQTINRPLAQLRYNEGSYIELAPQNNPDPEIGQFKQDLKNCVSQSGGDGATYSEEKFLQVKELLERFTGRASLSDVDARWRAKVTDVRNWFGFAVEEKWQHDQQIREFYSDSAGKSGGQKEKLAYTILAAALAYQLGLDAADAGARPSRHFRFVVIDEAFGRGSEASARYGLELFRALGLQLLVVTPLQKINVIEDFIGALHFVHTEDGRVSQVRNLTIEEYRQQRAAWKLLAEAQAEVGLRPT